MGLTVNRRSPPGRRRGVLMAAEKPVVVVGAGLVGLAVARQLLMDFPGRAVAVVEKESTVAAHQSGRNSGVIHSGVYYAPGSIHAQLCRRGGAQLREFCADEGIPVLGVGKLIVATNDVESKRLRGLLEQARANGIADAEMIGPSRHPGDRTARPWRRRPARPLDVQCRLHGGRRRRRGGDPPPGRRGSARLRGARRSGPARRRRGADGRPADLGGPGHPLPGLQADRLARCFGAPREPRIVPFRGSFWRLQPAAAALLRGHLYPVPDPALPFLGVHASRRHDGEVWLGPNAVLALAREGYRRGQADWRTLVEEASSPGLLRLMLRNWRTGLWELARDRSAGLVARSARRLLPELTVHDISPGLSGVRAQALGRDGRLVSDFVFWRWDRLLAVRNAPSPAATAALAIAEHISSVFRGTVQLGG